jgi:predicted porin
MNQKRHISQLVPFSMPQLGAIMGACLLAVGAQAQASQPQQSQLQLYGLVDVGYTHVSGLRGGSFNGLNSGVMEGSRWGMKGVEDLGGGYKALFTLESRFEADTGSVSNSPFSGTQLPDRIATPAGLGLVTTNPAVSAAYQAATAAVGARLGSSIGVNLESRTFDRQVFMGLITPFGALIAGRQYTPAYEISATFDTMQTQSALASGQIASIPATVDIRLSNTVQYRLQKDGWSAALMLGFGEVSQNTSANRFTGGMVTYKSDRFSVGAGLNARNNELGQSSLKTTSLGASVALGPGTLSTLFQTAKDNNPTGLSSISASLAQAGLPAALIPGIQAAYNNAFKQDNTLMHVGYKWPMGANTVVLSYSKFNDKTAANADTASYGIAVTHALSKRTDVSVVLAKVDNSARGQAVAGGGGYLGGVTRSAGVDSTSFQLAMRHRF